MKEWMNTSYFLLFINRVATDHNEDNTTTILRDWLSTVQTLYHYVEWRPKEVPRLVSFVLLSLLKNTVWQIQSLTLPKYHFQSLSRWRWSKAMDRPPLWACNEASTSGSGVSPWDVGGLLHGRSTNCSLQAMKITVTSDAESVSIFRPGKTFQPSLSLLFNNSSRGKSTELGRNHQNDFGSGISVYRCVLLWLSCGPSFFIWIHTLTQIWTQHEPYIKTVFFSCLHSSTRHFFSLDSVGYNFVTKRAKLQ